MWWPVLWFARLEQIAGVAMAIANLAYCLRTGMWLGAPSAALVGILFAVRTPLTRFAFTAAIFVEFMVVYTICDVTNGPNNVFHHFVHENLAPLFWYGLVSSIWLSVAWFARKHGDLFEIQSH